MIRSSLFTLVFSSLGLLAVAGCGGDDTDSSTSEAASGASGSSGSQAGGHAGSAGKGGSPGASGQAGQGGKAGAGGSGGNQAAGSGGKAGQGAQGGSGGSSGQQGAGQGGSGQGGSGQGGSGQAGTAQGGAGPAGPGGSGGGQAAGSSGSGGSSGQQGPGGGPGEGGSGGAGGSGEAGTGPGGSGGTGGTGSGEGGGAGAGGSGAGGSGGAPLGMTPPDCNYEGPIVIDDSTPDEGGTIYIKNRCFRQETTELKPGSTDQTLPCVSIETQKPVVIEDCIIVSASTLIAAVGGGADVTIRRTQGYGLEPTIDGVGRGQFLVSESFYRAEVERSYMVHTRGLQLWNKKGDGSDGRSVRVVQNVVREIDGRHRNGVDHTFSNFVGFNVLKARNVEIAWNEVINTPGESGVEDNIGLYRAGGFEDSPLHIHHNFIRGGWPVPKTSDGWTGSGVTTDGEKTHATDSQWAFVHDDVHIGVPFNIAIGAHNRYVDNTYISSGLMPDGSPMLNCYWCMGGIFDFYQTCGQNPPVFNDNAIINLTIGLNNDSTLNPPDCPEEGNTIDGTMHLPKPITLDTEAMANATWRASAQAAGVVLGP